MKTKLIGAAFLTILLYSCATKQAVEKTAPPAPVTAALSPELAEGKTLFENNCAKCHKLFNPTDFTKTQWIPIVASMQRKAKLDDAQGAKIYNYLTHDLK